MAIRSRFFLAVFIAVGFLSIWKPTSSLAANLSIQPQWSQVAQSPQQSVDLYGPPFQDATLVSEQPEAVLSPGMYSLPMASHQLLIVAYESADPAHASLKAHIRMFLDVDKPGNVGLEIDYPTTVWSRMYQVPSDLTSIDNAKPFLSLADDYLQTLLKPPYCLGNGCTRLMVDKIVTITSQSSTP